MSQTPPDFRALIYSHCVYCGVTPADQYFRWCRMGSVYEDGHIVGYLEPYPCGPMVKQPWVEGLPTGEFLDDCPAGGTDSARDGPLERRPLGENELAAMGIRRGMEER